MASCRFREQRAIGKMLNFHSKDGVRAHANPDVFGFETQRSGGEQRVGRGGVVMFGGGLRPFPPVTWSARRPGPRILRACHAGVFTRDVHSSSAKQQTFDACRRRDCAQLRPGTEGTGENGNNDNR